MSVRLSSEWDGNEKNEFLYFYCNNLVKTIYNSKLIHLFKCIYLMISKPSSSSKNFLPTYLSFMEIAYNLLRSEPTHFRLIDNRLPMALFKQTGFDLSTTRILNNVHKWILCSMHAEAVFQRNVDYYVLHFLSYVFPRDPSCHFVRNCALLNTTYPMAPELSVHVVYKAKLVCLKSAVDKR